MNAGITNTRNPSSCLMPPPGVFFFGELSLLSPLSLLPLLPLLSGDGGNGVGFGNGFGIPVLVSMVSMPLGFISGTMFPSSDPPSLSSESPLDESCRPLDPLVCVPNSLVRVPTPPDDEPPPNPPVCVPNPPDVCVPNPPGVCVPIPPDDELLPNPPDDEPPPIPVPDEPPPIPLLLLPCPLSNPPAPGELPKLIICGILLSNVTLFLPLGITTFTSPVDSAWHKISMSSLSFLYIMESPPFHTLSGMVKEDMREWMSGRLVAFTSSRVF